MFFQKRAILFPFGAFMFYKQILLSLRDLESDHNPFIDSCLFVTMIYQECNNLSTIVT